MSDKTQTTPAQDLVRRIKDHISACPNMENTVIAFHTEAYDIIQKALDDAYKAGHAACDCGR